MNTYFTRYYRGVILNVKLLLFIILLISLFACEQKKKSIIHTPSSYDIIMFYVFTDGFSSIKNCEEYYKYTIIKFNQLISNLDVSTYYRVYNITEGNKLILKNTSSDSDCMVEAYLHICNFIDLDESSLDIRKKICLNQNNYTLDVNTIDKEITCILNSDFLLSYQSSVIFAVSSNQLLTNSKKCSYSMEVK